MRVAHLTTVDSSLLYLLATELRVDVEAGLDVVAISAPGPFVERIESLGVSHVAVPELTRAWDLRRDLAAARRLARVLRGLRLDVLHTHNPKSGVLGRIIGRLTGIPVVVNTCHGLWVRPEDPWPRRAFVYGVEALAARFSHLELYQNDADRHAMRWAVPSRRSRTVGNGIDLSRFQPDEQARQRVRDELGIGAADLLVGGVGRRVVEKGILEFAHAARALAGQAEFVWIGPDDPDKPDRLRREEQGVRFLGMREDMPAVYAALDVFVLPSHREGFSRSAMEAAACGCASVLTDIRGCREVGRDGEELILVPPRDSAALTGALAGLLRDAELRGRLATGALARAHKEFDQRAVASASLAAYRDVALRRHLPQAPGLGAAAGHR